MNNADREDLLALAKFAAQYHRREGRTGRLVISGIRSAGRVPPDDLIRATEQHEAQADSFDRRVSDIADRVLADRVLANVENQVEPDWLGG